MQSHSLGPIQKLGLDPHKAIKLTLKLNAHSIQYAYKLVSTRHALEKSTDNSQHNSQDGGSASLPDSLRVWLDLAKLASPRAQKSWMPVMTLIMFLPSDG